MNDLGSGIGLLVFRELLIAGVICLALGGGIVAGLLWLFGAFS